MAEPRDLDRALWAVATASPAQIRSRLKQTKRGYGAFVLLSGALQQANGDVDRAARTLQAGRRTASAEGKAAIDEILVPLLISIGQYDLVDKVLSDDILSPSVYAGSRLALKAVYFAVTGQLERARQTRRNVIAAETGENLLLLALRRQRCGLSAFYCSDYDEAAEHSLQATQLFESIHAFRGASSALSVLYSIEYVIRENLDAAEHYARRQEQAARRCQNLALEIPAVVAQLEIAVDRGDDAAAASIISRVNRRRGLPPQYRERFALHLSEAIPFAWKGDFAALKSHLIVLLTKKTLSGPERAVASALLGLSECALGEPKPTRFARSAVAWTSEYVRETSKSHNTRYVQQCRAISAATFMLCGEKYLGRRLLAAKYTAPEVAKGVLSAIKGQDWRYAHESCRGLVRTVFAASQAVRTQETEASGILTRAELDVLRLLNEGLSAREIARESGRSVGTIYVHTRSITSKFAVRGRLAALAHARRLGIIS